MGVCHISAVTIDHDGNAKLSRHQLPLLGWGATGYYERRFSQREMQQLVDAIRQADFFENPFPLMTGFSNDGENNTVQIRMDGRERTVSTKRLARDSLLLVSYGYVANAPTLQVWRDGRIRLYQPGYLDTFEARLTDDRLRKLRASLSSLQRHRLRSKPPDDAIIATVSVPTQTDHQVFRLDLRASTEAAAVLNPLLDLRTYVDRSSIIRIKIESSMCEPRRELWPAEDLAPLAELEKRTFSAAEWNTILSRIWTVWNDDAPAIQLENCAPWLEVTVSPH